MKISTHSLLVTALALALTSCVKEEYDMNKISSSVDVKSAMAFPIASGTVTLEQLLPKKNDANKYIYVDKDNLLHLMYKQTFDSLTFGKYANIVKDVQSSITIASQIGVSLPVNSKIAGETSFNFSISLDRPEQNIEEAVIESGMLTLNNTSTFTSGTFNYSIETTDIQNPNGTPFKVTLNTTSTNQTKSISLAGCTFKPATGNQIRFKIIYDITKQSGSNTNEKVTLAFGLNSIQIKSLVGNLGQIKIPLLNNSFPLDFSDMVDNTGDFDIKDPKIKLIFRNEAGLPFSFTHSGVTAVRDNQVYNITGLPSPINIFAPIFGIETEKLSEAAIDQASNIVSVLAKFPKKLTFNGSLTANPSSITPPVKNRINAKDKLYVSAEADLPLNVRLSNVTLKDTSEYDFSSIVKDSKSIDQMRLQFQFKNGLPFGMNVTAAIVDATGKVLDNVFTTAFNLKPGEIQGSTIVASESKIDVTYTQSRIQLLKSGNRIIFTMNANTTGSNAGQTVKLLSTQKLDIKVVGFIQANLNNL